MVSPKNKKKPATTSKEKKMKITDKKKAEIIKEKLSGKIESPIVAKAKNAAKALKKKSTPRVDSALSKKSGVKGRGKVKRSLGEEKEQPAKGELKEIPLPKAEDKAKSKGNKRKLEEAVNETSKKKVKVAGVVGVSLRKTEILSPSTAGKKEKTKPVKKQGSTSSGKITKSIEAKAKNEKVTKTKGNDSQDKTPQVIAKKEAAKMKPRKKNLGAKKVGGSTGGTSTGERNVEGSSEPPVAVKRGKKPRKKGKSSISKLKPISNIKTLKKNPSPSTIRGRELRRKKLAGRYPERGVVYFSRIPHGFYEKELQKYCSQFGKVTGIYLPTSKSGNSKGYAFVEFKHKEVAEVVAETMNNYLMFYRLIKCKYLPPDEQKPWVFRRKLTLKKIADANRERDIKQRNRTLTEEEEKKWQEQKEKKIEALHKKLEAMGVDYDFQVDSGKTETEEAS